MGFDALLDGLLRFALPCVTVPNPNMQKLKTRIKTYPRQKILQILAINLR